MLGCGFARAFDTFTRVLGPDGQIHLTNPFHPAPADTLVLRRDGNETVEHPTVARAPFPPPFATFMPCCTRRRRRAPRGGVVAPDCADSRGRSPGVSGVTAVCDERSRSRQANRKEVEVL